jgi:hypothetical protein
MGKRKYLINNNLHQHDQRIPALRSVVMLVLAMYVLIGGVRAELHEPSDKLAFAPIRVDRIFMSVDDDDVSEFSQSIVEMLEEVNVVQLLDPDLSDHWMQNEGLDVSEGCFTRECMNELGTNLGADYVLSLSVSGEKRSSFVEYEIRLLSVSEQRVVLRDTGSSNEAHKLPAKAVLAAIELMLQQQFNPRGYLTVETIPPASAVLLNSNPVGFAPITLERASGLADTITVIRQGFVSKSRAVVLEPGETRTTRIELARVTAEFERDYPPIHVYVNVGQPLDQASSNLDSRVSWGEGESYGFRVDAGSVWRIGLGFILYDGQIDDIDPTVISDANAVGNPHVMATAIHSNLFYYPGSEVFSPYFGLGVAAAQRRVRLSYADFSEERSTDFEAAWMFMFGLEGKIYGPVQAHIELIHLRTLIESDRWSLATDPPEERVLWEGSFSDFSSFTVLRLGIGFTF